MQHYKETYIVKIIYNGGDRGGMFDYLNTIVITWNAYKYIPNYCTICIQSLRKRMKYLCSQLLVSFTTTGEKSEPVNFFTMHHFTSNTSEWLLYLAVLIMKWLQKSVEFSSSKLEIKLFSKNIEQLNKIIKQSFCVFASKL